MNSGGTDAGIAGPGSGGMLVIGYGNALRGDDGVGPAVAERVGALGLSGVRGEVLHQLTPELAGDVAEAGTVVFVDAMEADSGQDIAAPGVIVRELDAAGGLGWSGHRCSPEGLLALSAELYGRSPRAWCVAVPVRGFGWGPGLTEEARKGVEVAVEAIRNLWESQTCTKRV